jgi:hypothetical protein
MMEANPGAFFSSMTSYEREFGEWLNDLQDLSFTWYKSPPSPLEAKRKRLIAILEKASKLEADSERLRERTLERLRGIEARQVE